MNAREDAAIRLCVVIMVVTLALAGGLAMLQRWQERERAKTRDEERAASLAEYCHHLIEWVEAMRLEYNIPEPPPEKVEKPQKPSSRGDNKPLVTTPAPVTAAVSEPDGELTPRGAWMNDYMAPLQDIYQRVRHYVRAMGFANLTDEDIYTNCRIAVDAGYDPRLWAVVAMAESSGGNGSANYYGYCGGSSGPWAYVCGGWRVQSDWFHSRVTTFYSHIVDISKPENVLFYHYRGDPVTYDPHSVFYVDNVMNWLEHI